MAYISNIAYELRTTEVMGFKLPFKRFEGIDYNFSNFMPDNIEDHMQDLRDMEVREDDVFICTYPRSGTNWTNEIVSMLLSGSAEYKEEAREWVDIVTKHVLEGKTSPRIFASHFPLRYLPRQLSEKGRIICVFRNPKDVAVSFHHLLGRVNWAEYNGSIGDYLKLFYNGDMPCGAWFEYILEWEQDITNRVAKSILLIFYEDMKKDQRSQIEKIAHFLGIPHNSKLIGDIAQQCEFVNLNKEKSTDRPEIFAKLSKDRSNYLYWKGEVGNWKNWFTVAQNEEFDQVFKNRMKNSKLVFTYE